MRFSTAITVDGYSAIITVPPGSRAVRKANSIFCPLGAAPTRAWIILVRKDAVSLGSGTHTIVWSMQTESGTTNHTFSGLYLASGSRLLQGGADDDNSLYLCEFVDGRAIAAKHSDTGSIRANIRSYANSADYLTGTSGYTWTSLCTALWTACGTLGAWPGLPFAPDGVPQNQFIIGLNAWESLCTILDQLDCAVSHNPLTNTYSIVQLGQAQNLAFTNDVLRADFQPIQATAMDIAAAIRVWSYFHYESYGQERDTELATNWAFNGAGDLTNLATGATGAVAGTVKPIWDDLPIILDEINVRSNMADVTARATARKNRYVQRMQVAAAHKIYGGIEPIQTGGQVRAILWRNWNDNDDNVFGGTVTEYISGPEFITGLGGGDSYHAEFTKAPGAIENYAGPDLGRHSYPTYPRIANIVQVNNEQASAGDTVQAIGGLHSGQVKRWQSGGMVTMDPCWILFVDDFDTLGGAVEAKQGDYYGPGRLCGVHTALGSQRPIYLVRKGSNTDFVRFQLLGIISIATGQREAAGNICNVVGGAWVNNGAAITLVDPFRLGPGMWDGIATYQGFALKRPDGKYDIVWMETMARHIRFTAYTNIQDGVGEGTVADDEYFLQGRDPRIDGKVDIYDPQDNWTDVITGAKGGARFNDREARYEAIYCQRVAFLAKVTLTADLSADSNNLEQDFSGWEIVPIGEFILDPLVPETISNDGKFSGTSGDIVYVHRTNNAPVFTWRIYNVGTSPKHFIGKTASQINKGTSGQVNRHRGGTEVATGDVDTCRNLFQDLGQDKWVAYIEVDGTKYLIAKEC